MTEKDSFYTYKGCNLLTLFYYYKLMEHPILKLNVAIFIKKFLVLDSVHLIRSHPKERKI